MITRDRQIEELAKCFKQPFYFITNYVKIEDPIIGEWIPFVLWPEQAGLVKTLLNNLLVIILKARQLGMTWLVLAFALWLMLFRPMATVLLFSRRETESIHLLDDRLKGMYKQLPDWFKVDQVVVEDNSHEWQLSNGSVARAFPTTAGDSYTATLAIVDEADLVPNLNQLMKAVKPTIDAGGRMILLSRSDKDKPSSTFKSIYRAARKGLSAWVSVFFPWHVRPERDAAWYETQKQDILARTGFLDDLHEQYPATDTEALAPSVQNKRIPATWLEACFDELEPLEVEEGPAIPGLEIFRQPVEGRRYVIGVDPAEGNPTSDDSALEVLDRATQEEVALLAGKFQPSTLAAYADEVGKYFNDAVLMVERNNHGHAVLLWLEDNSRLELLAGHDGKPGWLSSSRGKTLLYSFCADAFKTRDTVVHSLETYLQLASIEGSSLRAPEGEHDDRADGYSLGLAGNVMADTDWMTDFGWV